MAARVRLGAQTAAVGLVLALLALLVWKLVHDGGSGIPQALARGEQPPAPEFSLPRLDAELPPFPGLTTDLSLAALRGRAVVLNFWASWCYPCEQEAPLLEETWRKHRDDGLVVVGINFNDLRRDAIKFIEKTGTTYPVVVDSTGAIVAKYGLRGVPETFFVDRRGRLVGSRIAGPVHEGRFREQFDEGLRLALGS